MNAHALPQGRPPLEAIVVERTQESPSIFTLRLRLSDAAAQAAYRFAPGQFNMLYLYGVGEVPISIMSDPEDRDGIGHTIQIKGRDLVNGIPKEISINQGQIAEAGVFDPQRREQVAGRRRRGRGRDRQPAASAGRAGQPHPGRADLVAGRPAPLGGRQRRRR